ncbi:MAG: mobA [Solimicrobium sp.]|jgi:molybdenum cofactor guanylyltransferase|nr:mobA [Solimicrobium sp.]
MHTSSHVDNSSITGLILAGGQAHRMQNRDKGLQKLDGKSLVAHVISRLAPQVATIVISANRHLEIYEQFGFGVYVDTNFFSFSKTEPNYVGPLGGLEIGLIHCKTPYLLTVPCDSPFLPTNLASRLLESLQQKKADIAVACTGEPPITRTQPVFCLVKSTLLAPLQQYLASGGRKMDGWYGQLTIAQVYFQDETEFRNINTLDELHACSTVEKS